MTIIRETWCVLFITFSEWDQALVLCNLTHWSFKQSTCRSGANWRWKSVRLYSLMSFLVVVEEAFNFHRQCNRLLFCLKASSSGKFLHKLHVEVRKLRCSLFPAVANDRSPLASVLDLNLAGMVQVCPLCSLQADDWKVLPQFCLKTCSINRACYKTKERN